MQMEALVQRGKIIAGYTAFSQARWEKVEGGEGVVMEE